MPSERETFLQQGFLHVPGVLSDGEVEALRSAASTILEQAGTGTYREDDYQRGAIISSVDRPRDHLDVCRVFYTFDKDPAFLMAAVHPRILQIAVVLHGQPSVITWEDMIVKQPGSPFSVPFHQDLDCQSTRSTVFSVGVYLDDSADDPLRLLPGSHVLGALAPEQAGQMASERTLEIVEIPAKAGDLVIHNVLAIHGSGRNRGRAARRVVYFEYRTEHQLRNDSPWSESWIKARTDYIPAAVAARRAAPRCMESDDEDLWSHLLEAYAGWLQPDSPAAIADLDLRVPHR